MGLFDRFRRGSNAEASAPSEHECHHGTLIAHWAQAADMGIESKATEWICQSCQMRFSPDEAEAVKKEALQRLLS
jgi:hypothetical protein